MNTYKKGISSMQKLAWFYAVLFFSVVAVGYIPGAKDSAGNLFGLFHIDLRDDFLHGFSCLWATYAALKGAESSRFYFRAFGSFYTTDAFVGFFTGYAIIDLALGRFGANAGYDMSNIVHNIYVNAPHFVIGPLAMFIGFYLSKKLMKA